MTQSRGFNCNTLNKRLRDNLHLKNLLVNQAEEKRFFGAICASPGMFIDIIALALFNRCMFVAVVLAAHGLLDSRQATCYPTAKFTDMLRHKDHIENRVVVDGNCVTSRGPGTSLEFALTLVEKLYGREKAEEVQRGLLVPSYWHECFYTTTNQ